IVIVNNTSAYTGLLGLVSSKLMNKKLLVEYNDLQALYTVELLKGRLNESLLKPLGRLLVSIEDVIVKNGWKVTAITGFIKRYAEERGTRRDITVIPDGVDTDFFNPSGFDRREIRSKYGIRDEEILCVYAGRIDICAGGELLVETVDLLDHRNIRFMLVGEGDPSLLKECCRRPNVILTGLVAREDVPRYLVAADIILVPFPDNLASHSISPLKLFEALAMEKIVIASDVSGIREVVTE
ncbi:MAG: glycosyltransferase, partial [Nitrososphaeria archaeon]|nr:glycosyltransferase [Nitrososphaeria archaeon]